jgi:Leucine-rich repeat (LRR) protein
MILGGKKFTTKIPVSGANASLSVLNDNLYNPYFVWWWHNLYEFGDGDRCIPYGCVFSSDGCTFTGGNYVDDLHGRHLLSSGTLGKWSHVYLTEGTVPFFGSVAGAGTKLYLNIVGTTPKITGKIILYPEYCPSVTHLNCQENLIDTLDIGALLSLTSLLCRNNSISVLDVSALTALTTLNCRNNSISVLDVSALTSLVSLDLRSNSFDQAMVDTILCDVDGWGTNSGALDISGNVAPSAAGITCKNNLIARGWTVTTD